MKFRRLAYVAVGVAAFLVLGSCGKGPKEEITVLIRMMPAQQRYFKNEILPAFEKKHNCKVKLTTFNNESDLKMMLELDARKAEPSISLVKTPFEITRQLAEEGLVQKLDEAVSKDRVEKDLAAYHPVAAALAMVNGEPYYLPRKLETRVLFYRKSKVAEAVQKFESHRSRIDAELKSLNSYGLPAGFTFDADPALWDLYDLYVAGSIWANETYNGAKAGRIALRGARYNGTSQNIIDRAYTLGATQDEIRTLKGNAIDETFFWEQAFIKNGLYNSGAWEDPWRGSHIYNAIKDGKAFLAYVQQIDLFNIHGWPEDPGMPSYLEDPEDMGVAVVPMGVSLSMNTDGKPAIQGTRKVSTGGWWWGIPTAAPKAQLAYELSQYITSQTTNAKESSQFGMIPVRKDLLENLSNVFEEGWVGQIYKVSVDQISMQLADSVITIVPIDKEYPKISDNLIDAWYEIGVGVVKNNKPVGKAEVIKTLDAQYRVKAKEILGDRYPATATEAK